MIRKLFFLLNKRKVKINGVLHIIPEALHRYFSLKSDNLVEPHIIKFLDKHVKRDEIFVDVGANMGIISAFVANKVGPQGRVFSFEPNPRIYNYLLEFLSYNVPYQNWLISQAAISDSIGLAEFSISMEDIFLMERSGLMKVDQHSDHQIVWTTTIDAGFKNQHVDWLKIDIEGAELNALEGALSCFEKNRPYCLVEIHGLYFDNPKAHAQNIFDFFSSKNYKAFNIHKGEWDTLESFIMDTGIHEIDRVNNIELSTVCYGNIAFVPEEKQNIF